MRFSIWPSPARSWDDIHEITTHCEQTGWDGVYFADHFMPNGPGPEPLDGNTLECWSIIAALAASDPRLRLAPLVTSVTYRHPAVLANIAAAVDQVSHGRLTLGIGAGWQENEHAAYGLELGTIRERMDRFEEAVQILNSLLREPRTTFTGQYFDVRDAPNQPAPVQDRLPLLIGGGGEKRTLRLVAQYGDACNIFGDPAGVRYKFDVLERHCADVGRDPAEITKTIIQTVIVRPTTAQAEKALEGVAGHGTAAAGSRQYLIAGDPDTVAERIAAYRDVGVDGMVVNMPEVADLDAVALAGETLRAALA
jgi:F420-dependent oxidoreductase-like protein